MISLFGLTMSLLFALSVGLPIFFFYPQLEAKATLAWEAYKLNCNELADRMFFSLSEKRILIWTLTPALLFALIAFSLTRGFIIINLIFTLAFALIGAQMLRWGLLFLWSKRLSTFNEQLTDALNLLANSLKAGLNLNQGIEVLVKEMADPISQEFGLVLSQEKVGLTLDDSLEKMIERVPSEDLAVALHSVLILRETGGDLAETFETIASTIRERRKIDGKIKSMTAQGRMQGYILLAMPFGFGAMIQFLNPGYLEPLMETQLGWMMILLMLVLQTVGALWIKKIITVDV